MRFTYLLVLLGCVFGTLPLELFLRVRVYRRWRRLLLTVLPVLLVFAAWDAAAIAAGHWDFDPTQLIGVALPGSLPVEEVLFFVVIPTCAILAFEAVRVTRDWPAGDE